MRTTLSALLVAAIALPVYAKPAPKPPVPLEEYFKIRRVGSRSGILMSFSHDEKLVAYLSDEGGRADVWVQPVAGGPAKQLTHVKGFIQGLAFSPTQDKLIYTTDIGGDELPHLFLTDSKGTSPRDILPTQPAGRRTDFVDWADDGKTFLYVSSIRDEKYQDLYEYDVATGKSERLWEASGKLNLANVSRDHKRFIIGETLSDTNGNLYLVERGKKDDKTLLTPHKGDALYDAKDISRDAKTLYYTSDSGREFTALYAMDLDSHASMPIAQPDWDVDGAGFTRGWKYFFTDINADGQSRVDVKDAETGKTVKLPAPPPGGAWVPLATSRTDRYFGVRLQGDGAPATPYVIDTQTMSAHKHRRDAAAGAGRSQDGGRRDRAHRVVRRQEGARVLVQARRRRAVPRGHRRARRADGAVAARVRTDRASTWCRRATWCWCRTCAARRATARRTPSSTTRISAAARSRTSSPARSGWSRARTPTPTRWSSWAAATAATWRSPRRPSRRPSSRRTSTTSASRI